jgi:hypothetical protein
MEQDNAIGRKSTIYTRWLDYRNNYQGTFREGREMPTNTTARRSTNTIGRESPVCDPWAEAFETFAGELEAGAARVREMREAEDRDLFDGLMASSDMV